MKINVAVPITWAAIGLSCIAAIIVGIVHYKPSARVGWILLALGDLSFIIGDTHYNTSEYIFGRSNVFPSLADAFYITVYPLLVAGMFIFIRRRTAAQSERGAILDAAIFTVGLAMLIWTYLVIPNAVADTTLTVKMLSITYPLCDIAIWAMLVRLLVIDSRVRAIQLLALGALGLIVADIVFGINQFYGIWSTGTWIDLGWILFYASWGAAALHPSMKILDKAVVKTPRVRMFRLVLLAATALIAPALLIVETARGHADQVAVPIAIFAAILFILVMLRMSTLVRAVSRREADIILEKKKNEAFSIVSHQLRTPATGVRQLLNLILEGYAGKLTSQQQKLLTNAYASNQRLLAIVEDLLSVGQADAGKLRLHKSKTDIVNLVQDVLDEQASKFAERKQKITFIHRDSELIAEMDLDRIRMVFENIIDNASKYTPVGKQIVITLSKLKKTIKMTIKDEGVGIEQGDLDRLFQKFSRIENPLSDAVGGTGLGLYWAKKIVDLHEGTIKVKSVPNRGTTFIITLPIQRLH